VRPRAFPLVASLSVGFLECTDLTYALPGGWTLFEGVSFRAPEGEHAGLVGANGIGKSTLLRVISGELPATSGAIRLDGRLGVMQQFIGSDAHPTTVREFLLSYAEPAVREAARRVGAAEARLATDTGERAQLAYAEALAAWETAGGYRAEVLWDKAAHVAFGGGYPESADRPIETLSGGERKRLALEAVMGGPFDVLLLDEPDNTLDIEGKQWLEATIAADPRTIVFVSHDRTVLDRAATQIVTLEGRAAWTHPGGFATYAEAREARIERLDERHRRYEEERQRLADMVKEMKRKAAYNDGWASKARSAEHRLERFVQREQPPEKAANQDVRMRVQGGRTGKVAFRARRLAIAGIVAPFDAEFRFGERIGVIGPNGSGKSHLLRLLSGEPIPHTGEWMLGARVEPALFAQLHERPDIGEHAIVDVVLKKGLDRTRAMSALRRYELDHVATNPFSLLSGGQQARFQILLMEIDSPTMLLLDEPTDNLDVASADALEEALDRYEGTVIAVTHDRWFMRLMDRFLYLDDDGSVEELLASPYGVAVR
jgi:ATPase subunit of ABC transporter with duplicated ATPase domains